MRETDKDTMEQTLKETERDKYIEKGPDIQAYTDTQQIQTHTQAHTDKQTSYRRTDYTADRHLNQIQNHRERYNVEIETFRQTDRQTYGERESVRYKQRKRDRQRQMHRDRQIETETHTCIETES